MKKLLVFFMCILLTVALTSCGQKNETQNSSGSDEATQTSSENNDITSGDTISDSDAADSSSNESSDNSASDSVTTPGSTDFTNFKSAISNFVSFYTNSKDPLVQIINDSEDSDTYVMSLLGFYTTDLSLAMLPFYDALDLTGTETSKVSGTLMLSGFEANKEKDGDLIRFSYNHTYDEDSGANVAGDITKETGYFDTKNNFLKYENTQESGGAIVQRNCGELSLLPDGTFISQSCSYDTRGMANGATYSIIKFTSDTLYYYEAVGEPDINFSYTTLENAGDISIDKLLNGLTPTFVIKVENGKATFETN